jgi:quinohemoprotein ethanol dehydrogenase
MKIYLSFLRIPPNPPPNEGYLVLAELVIDGTRRQVLMQANKNGFFYVLDRKTGQLISAKNFTPVTWASGVDLKTGRPIENAGIRYDRTTKTATLLPGAWDPGTAAC